MPAADTKVDTPDRRTARPSPSVRADTGSPLWVCFGILGLYALAIIWLYLHHEPWRDEAQAWLWALELQYPLDFLAVPGEGHPPLWFWLLRGLSYVLSFDHARLLMIPLALFNGWLFFKLIGRNGVVLFLCLFTDSFLTYWGFEFRPYALILTLTLLALVAERDGRSQTSLWLMALTTGLHFFGGFLFGFFVLVKFWRDRRLTPLIWPLLLAALFTALAIWSGSGNPNSALNWDGLAEGFILRIMRPFLIHPSPLPYGVMALAALALICFGLRKHLDVLVPLLVVLIGFGLFTQVVYGQYLWHSAFILVMVLMAYFLARPAPSPLFLIVLLTVQVSAGAQHALADSTTKMFVDDRVYAAVVRSAGGQLNPPENLVAWPDFVLSTMAARVGFRYISGNNGEEIGPLNWRIHQNDRIEAAVLGELETPYWLICSQCRIPLRRVREAGRQVFRVKRRTVGGNETLAAYRIED